MKRLFMLLTLALLLSSFASGEGEVFDGDTVYINDSRAYISATPHTIQGSGWVENVILSKQYSGEVTWVMLTTEYSREYFKPTRLQYYDDTLETVTVQIDNSTTEQVTREVGWTDVPRSFVKDNVQVVGKNRAYAITNIPVTANDPVRFRYYLEQTYRVPFGEEFVVPDDYVGKYDVAVFPSSYGRDVRSAFDDGNLMILDPTLDLLEETLIEDFEDGSNSEWVNYYSDGISSGLSWTADSSAPLNGTYSGKHTDSVTNRYMWNVLELPSSDSYGVCYTVKRTSSSAGKYSGVMLSETNPTTWALFNSDLIADLNGEGGSDWYTTAEGGAQTVSSDFDTTEQRHCINFNDAKDKFNVTIDGVNNGPYNVKNNGSITYFTIWGGGTSGTETTYYDDITLLNLPSTAVSVSNITISPSLNVDTFGEYTISANVTNSTPLLNVTLEYYKDSSLDTCQDYDFAGVCVDLNYSSNMTFNTSSGLWDSIERYSDLTPSISYADESVFEDNARLLDAVNQDRYHIFNATNEKTLTNETQLFIIFDAIARSSSNSVPLDVYLIEGNVSESFWTSDWSSSPSASLVSSIARDEEYDHSHGTNSSHFVVRLSLDNESLFDGLNITDRFYVVLRADSSASRGWDLSYRLENDTTQWLTADSNPSFTAPSQVASGVPDFEVHVVRFGDDFVNATVTAYYATGNASNTTTFSYSAFPNSAPNPSSFIRPVADELVSINESFTVSWNEAIDPNNDPVDYTLQLVFAGGVISTFLTDTTNTSYEWNISPSLSTGDYSMRLTACDDSDACTVNEVDFSLVDLAVSGGNATFTGELSIESNTLALLIGLMLVIAAFIFAVTVSPIFFSFAGVAMGGIVVFMTASGLIENSVITFLAYAMSVVFVVYGAFKSFS